MRIEGCVQPAYCLAYRESQHLFEFIVDMILLYFSCYGTVQSLGGDAEQSVAVEAVGQGECSIYSEDTITDEEGRFRLRGLLVRLY